jgi:hypothetical protein
MRPENGEKHPARSRIQVVRPVREPAPFRSISQRSSSESRAVVLGYRACDARRGDQVCKAAARRDHRNRMLGRPQHRGGVERAVRETLPGWVTRGNNWYHVHMSCKWATMLVIRARISFSARGSPSECADPAKELDKARQHGSWARGSNGARPARSVTRSPGNPFVRKLGLGLHYCCVEMASIAQKMKIVRTVDGSLLTASQLKL